MPVIVNEIEVNAPPPAAEEPQPETPLQSKTVSLTPQKLYGIKRKLLERRIRLVAR